MQQKKYSCQISWPSWPATNSPKLVLIHLTWVSWVTAFGESTSTFELEMLFLITQRLLLVMFMFLCLFCDCTVNSNYDRQSLAVLDTNAIYEGVLNPNNIVIHVTQNLVNFLASTLAWALLASLYQVTNFCHYIFHQT